MWAGNVFLWDRLRNASKGKISPYLSEFVHPRRPTVAAPTAAAGLSVSASKLPGSSVEEVQRRVAACAAAVLGGTVANFEQPLMEAGLDSLGVGLNLAQSDLLRWTAALHLYIWMASSCMPCVDL